MLPGFVNAHYHSELAIGPGLYQFIFERANVFMQGGVGDVEEDDLYAGVLWGLINAIKGGQTATVDMYYGRPGMPDFGCPPALRAYEDAGMRTAFGLVSRDENIYVHEPNERFLVAVARRPGRRGPPLPHGLRVAGRRRDGDVRAAARPTGTAATTGSGS